MKPSTNKWHVVHTLKINNNACLLALKPLLLVFSLPSFLFGYDCFRSSQCICWRNLHINVFLCYLHYHSMIYISSIHCLRQNFHCDTCIYITWFYIVYDFERFDETINVMVDVLIPMCLCLWLCMTNIKFALNTLR